MKYFRILRCAPLFSGGINLPYRRHKGGRGPNLAPCDRLYLSLNRHLFYFTRISRRRHNAYSLLLNIYPRSSKYQHAGLGLDSLSLFCFAKVRQTPNSSRQTEYIGDRYICSVCPRHHGGVLGSCTHVLQSPFLIPLWFLAMESWRSCWRRRNLK